MENQTSRVKETAHPYQNLFQLGGAAAILVVFLTVVEVVLFTIYPQPETVIEWFDLFQKNKLLGLVEFWGLEVPMYGMFILVFLALHSALKETNPGLMAIATIMILLGTGIFLATNNPFTMLSLSNQYTTAATSAEKATFLAAGQAVLANTGQRGVGGFNVGLFLVSMGGILVSAVMLSSPRFKSVTAYTGILAFSFSLADYLRQIFTQNVLIALLVILPGALILVVWFIMVSRELFQRVQPD